MAVESWETAWNNIIRDVIFSDNELKSLMMIPQNIGIIEFIDKYFIRAGYTSKILKDQPVRIIYASSTINDTQNYHVLVNQISFQIYVQYDSLHNADNDRLKFRTNLIADRLKKLLIGKQRVGEFKFWIAGQSDLGTSTINYARHDITFNYKQTY